MARIAQRQERISIRLSPQSKRKLERAAAYTEKTLTDFVVDVALAKAEAVVSEHEIIKLNAPEWERFQEMLLNPPEPNSKLKRAMAEHSRIVRN